MGPRTALAALLALTIGVTGCSNQREGQKGALTTVFSTVREQIKLRREGRAPSTMPQLTRAMLAGVKDPILSARLKDNSFIATMFVTARSGPHLTWKTLETVTLTTKNGIIVQTRGLPNDLMSVGTLPLRNTTGPRVYHHLAGDNQMRKLPLICDMTSLGPERIVVLERGHSTRHMQEVCTASDGQSITNDYWIGSDGTVWASEQWLGPELGHIRLERYIR